MTAPERDVEARAREVWRKLPALVGAECVEEIASALQAERERALEEAAKECQCRGAIKRIRALKARPPKRDP